MIERSENDPADRLMENVLDGNLGPLKVTDDMVALGLGRYISWQVIFIPVAPLLKRINTPANQRTDISTKPDLYNQTTPVEIGMLLDDLYQCANNDGGIYRAVFKDDDYSI